MGRAIASSANAGQKLMGRAIASATRTGTNPDIPPVWPTLPKDLRVKFPRNESHVLTNVAEDKSVLEYLNGTVLEAFVRLPWLGAVEDTCVDKCWNLIEIFWIQSI